MAHSKEPWREAVLPDRARNTYIVSDDGELGQEDQLAYYGGHLVAESIGPLDRRRIIACVNILALVSTEELEEAVAAGIRIVHVPRADVS